MASVPVKGPKKPYRSEGSGVWDRGGMGSRRGLEISGNHGCRGVSSGQKSPCGWRGPGGIANPGNRRASVTPQKAQTDPESDFL